jgi:hypothetical protein
MKGQIKYFETCNANKSGIFHKNHLMKMKIHDRIGCIILVINGVERSAEMIFAVFPLETC